jgi:uncharacterized protein (DUF2267 family)
MSGMRHEQRQVTSASMLQRACELGPFANERVAREVLFTALEVLGECLSADDARLLAGDLPGTFSEHVRAGVGRCEPREVYRRMASRRGVHLGLAVEQVQVVGHVIAESISRTTLERLRQHLPELQELFAGSPTESAEPAQVRAPGREGRLAARRNKDIGEGARKPTGHPEILAQKHSIARSDDPHADTKLSSSRGPAHAHSIARSDDPHADTKLSSSRGLSQEREGRSLSTAHPSKR